MNKVIGESASNRTSGQARAIVFFFFLLTIPVLACSLPAVPELPFATPEDSTSPDLPPTPVGDTLSYLIPAYAVNMDPGETVPGTRLTYVGRSGAAYEMTIDGVTAMKRIGDSLFWSGVVAPGVYANYNLRLSTSLFGGVPVAGPVELIVFNPAPIELLRDEAPDASLHYGNLVIDFTVPVGTAVPGTTFVFEGIEVQGIGNQSAKLARFGGLPGYPNLAVGDSLIWRGKLRDNVIVSYNLRALSFDEHTIRLVGTGDFWIVN